MNIDVFDIVKTVIDRELRNNHLIKKVDMYFENNECTLTFILKHGAPRLDEVAIIREWITGSIQEAITYVMNNYSCHLKVEDVWLSNSGCFMCTLLK